MTITPDDPRCKAPNALRGGPCITRPHEHPQHTFERHRIETSDVGAIAGGYYGVYDPRPNVDEVVKMDEAIKRHNAIFGTAARFVAVNPVTAQRLFRKPAGIAFLLRYWIPADTFYVGTSENGIAP